MIYFINHTNNNLIFSHQCNANRIAGQTMNIVCGSVKGVTTQLYFSPLLITVFSSTINPASGNICESFSVISFSEFLST